MIEPVHPPSAHHPQRATGGEDLLAALLGRIAAQDEEALSRFYELTKRRVFGLALAIAGDPQTADESALDVYTQVWRRAATFDPTRGDVWSWILAIARSRCLDLVRARSRQLGRRAPFEACADKACGASSAESACIGAESARRVRQAVLDLPATQREAIQTAYFGGLSYSETAEALGLPVGTVKTRIRAALAGLRSALNRLEEDSR